MNIELLGFDAKIHPKYYSVDLWPDSKRCQYLIKPEAKYLFSVDSMVWPSIFHYFSMTPISNFQYIRKMINVKPLNTRHDALQLWTDLNSMIECLGPQDGIQIAVTLNEEKDYLLDSFWRAVLDPNVPIDNMPKEWQSFGYDVADRDMISGISNCIVDQRELISLREIWAQCLNDFGLFLKMDDAKRFRHFLNNRIPSHSPFFIYEIFFKNDQL